MMKEIEKETSELIKIVNEWKRAIDCIASVNQCSANDLIGYDELGNIYKQITKLNYLTPVKPTKLLKYKKLDTNKDMEIAVKYLRDKGGICCWKDVTPEMSERMFYASMKGIVESYPETETWMLTKEN